MKNKRSTSEISHAKNAANFNAAINIVQGMGAIYQPSHAYISIDNLLSMQGSLNTCLQKLSDIYPQYRDAVAARETAFEPLAKLGTRVYNAFKAVQTDAKHRQTVLSFIRRLRGAAKGKGKENAREVETEDSQSISKAHLSYDNRAATLQALISYLATHPEYVPNEPELQIAGLKDYYLNLMTCNNNVSLATVALITTRKERNAIMYDNQFNIYDAVGLIKSYVKSLSEATEFYNALRQLSFMPRR